MDGFGGLIVMFIVISIISSVIRTAKGNQKKGGSAGNAQRGTNAAAGFVSRDPQAAEKHRQAFEELEKARQERLARANDAIKRASEAIRVASGQSQKAAAPEKPIVDHSTRECGGGSIHDGYHEGSVRRPQAASSAEGLQGLQGARRGVYAKGTTGQGMASSEAVFAASARGKEAAREAAEYAKESEAHSAIYQSLVSVPEGPRESGADKLQKAIGDKSGIVQGIIWSEVLGRPRAEQQQ